MVFFVYNNSKFGPISDKIKEIIGPVKELEIPFQIYNDITLVNFWIENKLTNPDFILTRLAPEKLASFWNLASFIDFTPMKKDLKNFITKIYGHDLEQLLYFGNHVYVEEEFFNFLQHFEDIKETKEDLIDAFLSNNFDKVNRLKFLWPALTEKDLIDNQIDNICYWTILEDRLKEKENNELIKIILFWDQVHLHHLVTNFCLNDFPYYQALKIKLVKNYINIIDLLRNGKHINFIELKPWISSKYMEEIKKVFLDYPILDQWNEQVVHFACHFQFDSNIDKEFYHRFKESLNADLYPQTNLYYRLLDKSWQKNYGQSGPDFFITVQGAEKMIEDLLKKGYLIGDPKIYSRNSPVIKYFIKIILDQKENWINHKVYGTNLDDKIFLAKYMIQIKPDFDKIVDTINTLPSTLAYDIINEFINVVLNQL